MTWTLTYLVRTRRASVNSQSSNTEREMRVVSGICGWVSPPFDMRQHRGVAFCPYTEEYVQMR